MLQEAQVLVKVALILSGVLCCGVPATMLCQRRFGARLQRRYGPRAAGPRGVLQPLADLVKLMARQQPGSANVLAPVLGLVAALMVFAAIPFGENITWAGQMHAVQVADPGLLYVLAVLVLFFFAPLWGGWSAGDQRSLLDGVRHAARQLGYLLCIGLSAVGILLLSGSASLADIVQAQARSWGPLPLWNGWLQPLGCVVFAVAGLCWAGLPPLESDRAATGFGARYDSAYGGGPLALWQLADHARLLAVACLAVALYGGGWHCPGWAEPGVGGLGADLAKVGIFAAKTALALLALLWLRWSLPGLGLRRGQSLAWKVLLPLSLVNLAAVTWIATLL
jgi:NADH-quinone oxidoreductase subunit H